MGIINFFINCYTIVAVFTFLNLVVLLYFLWHESDKTKKEIRHLVILQFVLEILLFIPKVIEGAGIGAIFELSSRLILPTILLIKYSSQPRQFWMSKQLDIDDDNDLVIIDIDDYNENEE